MRITVELSTEEAITLRRFANLHHCNTSSATNSGRWTAWLIGDWSNWCRAEALEFWFR